MAIRYQHFVIVHFLFSILASLSALRVSAVITAPRTLQRSRCGDKGVEESLLRGAGCGGEFGMPLHGNQPGVVRHFNRLNRSVGCMRNDVEPGSDVANSLVMPGGRAELEIKQNVSKPRARLHANSVLGRFSRRKTVEYRFADDVRKMLVQSSAESDVDQL